MIRAGTLTTMLLFATLGCAPLASFRPPAFGDDDRATEFGMGGVVQTGRPFVSEPTRGAGQAWFSRRTSERVDLAAMAAFDASAFALGGAAELDLVRAPAYVLAIEPEAGFLWAGLRVPAALRLYRKNALYVSPRVAARSLAVSVDLPVGLSVDVAGGVALRAEWATSWTGKLTYYEQRQTVGVGLALRR